MAAKKGERSSKNKQVASDQPAAKSFSLARAKEFTDLLQRSSLNSRK
jgi:hypothetical protein